MCKPRNDSIDPVCHRSERTFLAVFPDYPIRNPHAQKEHRYQKQYEEYDPRRQPSTRRGGKQAERRNGISRGIIFLRAALTPYEITDFRKQQRRQDEIRHQPADMERLDGVHRQYAALLIRIDIGQLRCTRNFLYRVVIASCNFFFGCGGVRCGGQNLFPLGVQIRNRVRLGGFEFKLCRQFSLQRFKFRTRFGKFVPRRLGGGVDDLYGILNFIDCVRKVRDIIGRKAADHLVSPVFKRAQIVLDFVRNFSLLVHRNLVFGIGYRAEIRQFGSLSVLFDIGVGRSFAPSASVSSVSLSAPLFIAAASAPSASSAADFFSSSAAAFSFKAAILSFSASFKTAFTSSESFSYSSYIASTSAAS